MVIPIRRASLLRLFCLIQINMPTTDELKIQRASLRSSNSLQFALAHLPRYARRLHADQVRQATAMRLRSRNPPRFCGQPLLTYSVGGLMMTKLDDAEKRIIREWDAWVRNQSDPASSRDAFYRHLQKERPELLKFRYTGDKWQRVYGCLLRAGRVRE